MPVLFLAFVFAACSNEEKSSTDDPTEERDTTVIEGDLDTPDEPIDTTTSEPDTTVITNPSTTSDIRLGYINSVEILDKLPSVKRADQQVQQYAQQLDQEIKRRSEELQKTYDQYSKDTDVSESIMQTRMMELQQMQQNLTELQYSSEQELAKKRDELYKPILKQIDQAIGTVAKQEGFTHVLDASAGALVYSEDRFDMTRLVLRQLGL